MSQPPSVPRRRTSALNIFDSIFIEPEEEKKYDMRVFFNAYRHELFRHIEHAMNNSNSVKWHLLIKVILEKMNLDGDVEVISTYFHTNTYSEHSFENIQDHLDEGFEKINSSLEKFLQNGSGWVLKEICHFELKLAKFNPLRGSSYIPLPKKLARKKAILNIQNFDDEKCFLWCILAHKLNLERNQHPERVCNYQPLESEINMGDVSFPVPFSMVKKIEQLNNLRINVYGYEEGEVFVLHVSEQTHSDVINLLLISDGEQNHYCLIRDFSRFLGHRTLHDGKMFHCFRCLQPFNTERCLKEHSTYCSKQEPQVIKMPKEGEHYLKFTGTHLQHPVNFVIYADFESLLVPIQSATPSSSSSYQVKTARHEPCGFAYVIVGSDGRNIKPMTVYRGEKAVEVFLEKMIEERRKLGKILNKLVPMKLTEQEEKLFREATECSICHRKLGEKRVRDHDHVSGAFRGSAHPFCNLNFKQPKIIPVVFHNLKNYDGHHIMTKISQLEQEKIDVIATTMEKYISFRMRHETSSIQMVFIDSLQFLPASLDKLVQNLDECDLKLLRAHFPLDKQFTLVKKKGIYPYEYFDCHQKFQETQLPNKSSFYSKLTDEHITDEEYIHAQNIWNTFKMQNLGCYHDLYVKTDVLLLADVFQNFRKLCMDYYGLEAARLFTSPGLSFQACLKMTGVQLELLTDANMLMLFEQGIRGGVSQISHRFATANNNQVPGFKPEEDSTHIMYWDANNLYGWAMSQYLPNGGFEWVDPLEFNEEKILNIPEDADQGYLFEVDLIYPPELHDDHNEYPLAPEKLKITEEMLSPYCNSQLKWKFSAATKLVPNLKNKEKYITHYRNLQLYLRLGLKISKIHKVIQFNQSPWLREYISFNTEKRKQAKSSFERDFFKLLNNSIYGKCIENLRKHRNIGLFNDESRAQKVVSSPAFHSFKIFDEKLVAVERKKSSILMNRPIYVGFAILELSKVLMYDFHYNFVKKLYPGDRSLLLFTDTDSLTYLLKTEDLQKDLRENSSMFDFSDYPQDHPLYSLTNKKVLGKFKDELNGEAAHQFVGLKSKMYSLKSSKEEKKRAKGVSSKTVKKKITHQDYVNCILHEKTTYETQRRIGQELHQLYTIEQNKKCLSPFDDKRYLLDDGIQSMAYGHYKIDQLFSEQVF